MNNYKDHTFGVVCNNTTSDWTNGRFRFTPVNTIIADGEFLVCLKEISIDYNVKNIQTLDMVKYKNPNEQFWRTIRVLGKSCDNVNVLIKKINDNVPEEIDMTFTYNAALSRVEVSGNSSQNIQVYIMATLAEKLGFVENAFALNKTIADQPPNVYAGFEYVNIMCPGICEVSVFNESVEPLLRSFRIPLEKLMASRRLTISFDGEERWVPLCVNKLNNIEFVLTNYMNTPIRFVQDTKDVIVQLAFHRVGLTFP